MENGGGAGAIGALISMVISLGIAGVFIYAGWKVFAKAGQPGWVSLVPIYNIYVMITQVLGGPILWLVFMLIPCVNLYGAYLVTQHLAKSFGKSSGFGWGLFFLGPIFLLMLAFGDAKYEGPSFKG